MTIVVNLLAGPGVGKSTCAAELFAQLKYRQLHCELVTEFVKRWAWQNRKPTIYDQLYLAGVQSQSESLLYHKVDYIVTDSPIILAGFYDRTRSVCLPAVLNFLALTKEDGIIHKNFFLERSNRSFDSRGRFEDEASAKSLDFDLKEFLDIHHIQYTSVSCPESERANFILKSVLNEYNHPTSDRSLDFGAD